MDGDLLFLHAETPIHAGGAESLGSVDLPIQRDTTGLPVIWGQSLKGCLRAHARDALDDADDVKDIFGSSPEDSNLQPGWLAVGDARAVAMPVPTLRQTFAWVTCPLELAKLRRLARLVDVDTPSDIPRPEPETALSANDGWTGRTALADLVVETAPDHTVAEWAAWLADHATDADDDAFSFFHSKMSNDLLVVADGVHKELTTAAVDVVARVRLEENRKTVARGGLFYEENLPAETVLVTLLRDVDGGSDRSILHELVDGKVIVLGGDETVGKGLLWARLASIDAEVES